MKFLILLSDPCAGSLQPPAHAAACADAAAATWMRQARDLPAARPPMAPRPVSTRRARWRTSVLALLGLAGLAGCASAPDALEASFGMATQCVRLMQTADPLAPWRAWHHGQPQPRTDGVNARLGVEHYRARLAQPEAPASVIGKGAP